MRFPPTTMKERDNNCIRTSEAARQRFCRFMPQTLRHYIDILEHMLGGCTKPKEPLRTAHVTQPDLKCPCLLVLGEKTKKRMSFWWWLGMLVRFLEKMREKTGGAIDNATNR